MKSCPNEEAVQRWLDGEEANEALEAHLASCAQCAATAQEMEQTFAAIGNAFAVTLPDTVPSARLRARIASALTEQAAPRFAWANWFWRFGWAAAMVVIAGIIIWNWQGTTSLQQPQQSHNETPAPTAPPAPPWVIERAPEIAHHAARPRVRQRAVRNKAEVTELVTQFFPLREGDDLASLENMRLVRVALPGSALGEVGLPVTREIANSQVKADVVLGDDGLARAIRFVR